MNNTDKNLQKFLLPAFIILGILVMGIIAVFFISTNNDEDAPKEIGNQIIEPTMTDLINRLHAPIEKITSNDYIRGNPNAPIMFVSYTDYDCELCGLFHIVMSRIVQAYGSDGLVALTKRYASFNDDTTKSLEIANAVKCVGELAGNVAYWKLSDILFETRHREDEINLNQIKVFNSENNVNTDDFDKCVNENRYYELLKNQNSDAVSSGAFMSPFTVFIVGDEVAVIRGYHPYIEIATILENIIDNIPE